MEHRFAFAAQYWGDGAVVCRATCDRPGPVVEPQFGEFRSWTQAQNFANKLNEGLDLDPLEVRKIVTSSLLATACVVQEALNSNSSWTGSSVEVAARAAQFRFILSELALALTLCRSAVYLSEVKPARRILERARKVLHHSTHFLGSCDGDYPDLQGIASKTQLLNDFVQQIDACLPACLPALGTNGENLLDALVRRYGWVNVFGYAAQPHEVSDKEACGRSFRIFRAALG